MLATTTKMHPDPRASNDVIAPSDLVDSPERPR